MDEACTPHALVTLAALQRGPQCVFGGSSYGAGGTAGGNSRNDSSLTEHAGSSMFESMISALRGPTSKAVQKTSMIEQRTPGIYQEINLYTCFERMLPSLWYTVERIITLYMNSIESIAILPTDYFSGFFGNWPSLALRCCFCRSHLLCVPGLCWLSFRFARQLYAFRDVNILTFTC